jgi:hypothetical protein
LLSLAEPLRAAKLAFRFKNLQLNYLERILPEGLLVDAAWLIKRGYSTSLRSQYVSAGWLEQPARQVYRRPRGSLGWQQVVISLQTLLRCRLTVGGRTALELEGYAHWGGGVANDQLRQRNVLVHLRQWLCNNPVATRWFRQRRR